MRKLSSTSIIVPLGIKMLNYSLKEVSYKGNFKKSNRNIKNCKHNSEHKSNNLKGKIKSYRNCSIVKETKFKGCRAWTKIKKKNWSLKESRRNRLNQHILTWCKKTKRFNQSLNKLMNFVKNFPTKNYKFNQKKKNLHKQ